MRERLSVTVESLSLYSFWVILDFGDDDHDGLIAICDGDFDSPGLDANLDCEHPILLPGHLLAQVAFEFGS